MSYLDGLRIAWALTYGEDAVVTMGRKTILADAHTRPRVNVSLHPATGQPLVLSGDLSGTSRKSWTRAYMTPLLDTKDALRISHPSQIPPVLQKFANNTLSLPQTIARASTRMRVAHTEALVTCIPSILFSLVIACVLIHAERALPRAKKMAILYQASVKPHVASSNGPRMLNGGPPSAAPKPKRNLEKHSPKRPKFKAVLVNG